MHKNVGISQCKFKFLITITNHGYLNGSSLLICHFDY
jgi:hypothetical protein